MLRTSRRDEFDAAPLELWAVRGHCRCGLAGIEDRLRHAWARIADSIEEPRYVSLAAVRIHDVATQLYRHLVVRSAPIPHRDGRLNGFEVDMRDRIHQSAHRL